jgi:restriction system protein
MTRYWVIAPYDSTRPELFDKAWEYDLVHGTIAIGWRQLWDLSDLADKDDLRSRIEQAYGEGMSKGSITRDTNAVWAFLHEIEPGDVVIARRGTKRIIGIGEVTGPPFYDETRGQERLGNLSDDWYARFLPVRWEDRQIDFDSIVFSFYTLYEIPEEKYRELTQEETPQEEELRELSAEFALEKHLEDFIVTNFGSIFQGQLELHREEGVVGQQYPIVGSEGKQIGYIDILAREPSTNAYVVIELKKGREADRVVGQTLRYMGWVSENLCQSGEDVKGLIICREVDERLEFALKMVRNMIQVKRYSVSFQLHDL